MYGDLGGRQLEDQPASAGVDPCESKHVTDEDPVSLRVGAVENDVCSVDHGSLPLLVIDHFVLLCPPLRLSGRHPRRSEIPFSLQRHPTACTSRLQEKATPISHPFYRCGEDVSLGQSK